MIEPLELIMDGTLDLSFEAFQDLDNIPTASGRGWLASNLNKDDWTVKMSDDGKREIASMIDQMMAKPLPTYSENRRNLTFLSSPIYIKKPKISVTTASGLPLLISYHLMILQ